MENHIVIATVEQDGVTYDLVVRRVDRAALDALPQGEAGAFGGTIVQEPKVVARRAS